jgi:glycosyltransferase involved in cell wall biosynthesis
MNVTPLVSVIVPCYNSGKTLSRTINSVIRQTWERIEIIIINDGSTDKFTIEQLDFFSTEPKITIYSQSNKGLSSARNRGISISNGEYIMPLDSDDWLDNNAIKIMLDAYNKSNLNSIVFSDIKLEGKRVGVKETFCNPFEQLFSNQLPYCMLFPKSVFNEIPGYDETLLFGLEDWDLNIRLLINKYNFVKVNKSIFHYQVDRSGMFQSVTSKRFGYIFNKIKQKNSYTYVIFNLLRVMKHSIKIPSNRNLFLYLIQNSINNILPVKLFNYVYYLINQIQCITLRRASKP